MKLEYNIKIFERYQLPHIQHNLNQSDQNQVSDSSFNLTLLEFYINLIISQRATTIRMQASNELVGNMGFLVHLTYITLM